MPLFDFRCTSCHQVFEALVRDEREADCPACGTVTADRMIAMPARPAGHANGALTGLAKFGPPPGGGCCGGGCGH